MSNCNCQTVYTASIDEDFTGKCVKDTYQKVIHVGEVVNFRIPYMTELGHSLTSLYQMYQKH